MKNKTMQKKMTEPVQKPVQRREPTVTTNSESCPRCGEDVSIVLIHKSTSGVLRYKCFSEQCKNSSPMKGKGRQFVLIRD